MYCFTDDQIDRGLQAVILAHDPRGDRCIVCGETDDAHDPQEAHPFTAPNLRDIFLEAARDASRDPTIDGVPV